MVAHLWIVDRIRLCISCHVDGIVVVNFPSIGARPGVQQYHQRIGIPLRDGDCDGREISLVRKREEENERQYYYSSLRTRI